MRFYTTLWDGYATPSVADVIFEEITMDIKRNELCDAATNGDVKAVEELLAQDAPVDARDAVCSTSLSAMRISLVVAVVRPSSWYSNELSC